VTENTERKTMNRQRTDWGTSLYIETWGVITDTETQLEQKGHMAKIELEQVDREHNRHRSTKLDLGR